MTKQPPDEKVLVKKEGGSWAGNFTNNDPVLETGVIQDGILQFVFSFPVVAVGANIQTQAYGAFTGLINVYDAANVLLVSYTLAGLSSGANDGSAIFMGVKSLIGAVIKRIDFMVTPLAEYGINRVNFVFV